MSILLIGTRRVDLRRGEVEGHGALARRELALLKYFVDHRDRVIAQDELLREVWGYSPQVRTRALYTAVYRLRSVLEDDPANPRVITAERGEGYQFSLPPDDPRVEPRVEPCGCTFGRDAELARVRAALAAHRLVTLVGAPGVGKTRVARAIAAEAQAEVVWVPPGSSTLYGALAGNDGMPRRRTLDGVVRELERRSPVLLVVDGADQRVDLARDLTELLAQVRGATALVTARGRIDADDEQVIHLDPLGAEPALELLLARVGAPAPDLGAARELVERVSGLPLALEGVAAMVQSLGWCATADLLGQSLARIKVVETGRRPGMAAAVAHGWSALEPADRQQLIALTPFRGGFTLAAARSVVGDEGSCCAENLAGSGFRCAESLTRLRERSWVFLTGDRFHLFDIVRDLIEDLVPEHSVAAARLAHAQWVGAALDQLDHAAERANVEAALQTRLRMADGAASAALIHWLDRANLGAEHLVRYAERVLALALDDERRSTVESCLARNLRRTGRYTEALDTA
ncbi:MAG: winged helix-turn-helix domain-containing protein, partial [Myxococcota bacterium]